MTSERNFTISWTITKSENGLILRDYLRERKGISKSALTDIKFNGGKILVNDYEVNVRYRLADGDKVTIYFPEEKISKSMKPEKLDFTILHEDEHYIIVNKLPYIPTIPSKYHPTGSLAQGILYYYQQTNYSGTIHAVNRLDRNTSGIVIIAKHRYAHSLLSLKQRDKSLTREYRAIVHGEPDTLKGVIKKPIGRKANSIIERAITNDGKYAETHYEVLRCYGDYSLISLMLKTGRTHQIRVHMSSIGHPLLGDDLYGGKTDLLERQALHSYKVSFIHPFTQQLLELKAPLPSDMAKLCF